MEKYEFIREIALGGYSVAKLMRYRETNELVAMKFIPRGDKINENVAREILNHRSLQHPNIVRFKEVVLTPTHLAIVMEYAAGGELFHRITTRGAFSEDEARYFFRQIISGISYCHSMQICHRDLKLENTLLDGTLSLRLKICDFGFSKSYLHSRPRSMVGSPAYVAPEVFYKQEYDGKLADVWSCGVILYVMLVGTYPFEDPNDPKNLRNSVQRTIAGVYQIPKKMAMTHDCKHLLSQIFVTDPTKRITMDEIKKHPWFLNNSSRVWAEKALYEKRDSPVTTPLQSVDEISKIVMEARIAPVSSFPDHGYSDEELKDKEAEADNGKQVESKGLSQCGPVETTKLVDQAIVKIKKIGLVETKLVDQAIAERKKTGPVETTKLVDQAVVERKKCAIRRNASR